MEETATYAYDQRPCTPPRSSLSAHNRPQSLPTSSSAEVEYEVIFFGPARRNIRLRS